jgi:hypothetical protein
MMVQVRVLSRSYGAIARGIPRAGGAAATAAVFFLVACSARHQKEPPAIGDCVPQQDASCAIPTGVTGGAGGGGDSGAGPDADSSIPSASDAGACGAVLLAAQSTNCQPCIADACCRASTACAADPQCQALVTCAENCTPGAGIGACAAMCQSYFPTATTAYDDFSTCEQARCPQCPTLPRATLSDL